MDHARGPPRQKRHVQSVKYQLRGERDGLEAARSLLNERRPGAAGIPVAGLHR